MSSISWFSINLLLGILSYLVPKNKKQILLGDRYGYSFSGNTKYFYFYLLNKKQNHFDKIFWITKSKKIYSDLKKKNLPVIYMYSIEGFKEILHSNLLVISHTVNDVSYFPFMPGNFNVISCHHGSPSKGSDVILEKSWNRSFVYNFVSKRKKSYKAFVATSEYAKQRFTARGFRNIIVLGYPRNDVLFSRNTIYENFQTKFNLSKYAKVILYAPTFRDRNSRQMPFSLDFLNKLNEYLLKNNFVFLLKNHPQEELDFNINNYSNIIDVSDNVDDVQDLLIDVDIVITDYSSIVMDFVLLNRPIIFYPYDFDEYIKSRKLDTTYYTDRPGPFVKNENELFDLIKSVDVFFKQANYREKYIEFRTRFNQFGDGYSSERLYNWLMENYV